MVVPSADLLGRVAGGQEIKIYGANLPSSLRPADIDLGSGDDVLSLEGTPIINGDFLNASSELTLEFGSSGSFTGELPGAKAVKNGEGTFTLSMLNPMERIEVSVDPGVDTLIPGSESFRYSLDGESYADLPLAHLGGTLYRATLPALPCGEVVFLYAAAESVESGVVAHPREGEADPATIPVGVTTDDTRLNRSSLSTSISRVPARARISVICGSRRPVSLRKMRSGAPMHSR